MRQDSDTSINELLSDQQRIELLEKTGKLNRLLIYGLGGGLVVALLAILLVGLLGGSSGDSEENASTASVVALEKKLADLEQQVAPLKQQVQNQQKLFDLLKGGLPAPVAAPAPSSTAPSGPDHASQQLVATTLIGQEQSYQKTIVALKNGMRDLAGMIAGSRSWLEDYEADLNKPLAESQARVKALQQWSSGKSATATQAP